MNNSRKFFTATFLIAVLSTNINAAIVSVDWQSAGDNLITRDSVTGLDWLDLTVTQGKSYNNILSQLEPGQLYEGWRYASRAEVLQLWNNMGAPIKYGTYISLSSVEFQNINYAINLLGNTFESVSSSLPLGAHGITATSSSRLAQSGYYKYVEGYAYRVSCDCMYIYYNSDTTPTSTRITEGSYLVAPSAVPIPPAIILFGSGLIGLIGIAKRKKI